MKKTSVLLRVLKISKAELPLLLLSLVLAIAHTVLNLLIPLYAGNAIDLMLGENNVLPGVTEILLKILVMTGAAALIGYIMSAVNNAAASKVAMNVRQRAFEKIHSLPMKYLDGKPAGDILSRITSDTEQISDGLLLGFTHLFTGIATIIGTLVLMFSINYIVAIAVFVLTPVSLFVSRFIAKRTYGFFHAQSKDRAKQTSTINEALSSLNTITALGAKKSVTDRFEKENEDLIKSSFKATFYSSLTNPVTRFVNSLVYAAVALFGALAAMSGAGVGVGALACLLSYANKYTKPFNEISGVIAELQGAIASAARVFELLDEEPEADEAEKISFREGDLAFDKVTFSYTPERELIKDLSFNVKAGYKVAVVGPTGCGKTTLINLLMRFYDPQSGAIKLDGSDISAYSRESLREVYAMVLQDTWIRSGTVHENIAVGKADASREEVINAAKQAHAHSFIKQLPKGYDTKISEGYGLSEGQKQLLCIARAIISDPKMLILDEATSSIDTLTEKRVQRAFDEMTADRTSFVVAHRMSTITDADLILVMKDGNIIEKGKHEELLSRKGFYYDLYNSRYSPVTDTV